MYHAMACLPVPKLSDLGEHSGLRNLTFDAFSLKWLQISLGWFSKSRLDTRGALGYFLGGYVPPETPNWHPVLKKNSPEIDTPF